MARPKRDEREKAIDEIAKIAARESDPSKAGKAAIKEMLKRGIPISNHFKVDPDEDGWF